MVSMDLNIETFSDGSVKVFVDVVVDHIGRKVRVKGILINELVFLCLSNVNLRFKKVLEYSIKGLEVNFRLLFDFRIRYEKKENTGKSKSMKNTNLNFGC